MVVAHTELCAVSAAMRLRNEPSSVLGLANCVNALQKEGNGSAQLGWRIHFHREKQYSFGFAPLRGSFPECAYSASHHACGEVSVFNHLLRLVFMRRDVQRMEGRFVAGFGRDAAFRADVRLLLHSPVSESGPYVRRIDPSHCVCSRRAFYHVSQ